MVEDVGLISCAASDGGNFATVGLAIADAETAVGIASGDIIAGAVPGPPCEYVDGSPWRQGGSLRELIVPALMFVVLAIACGAALVASSTLLPDVTVVPARSLPRPTGPRRRMLLFLLPVLASPLPLPEHNHHDHAAHENVNRIEAEKVLEIGPQPRVNVTDELAAIPGSANVSLQGGRVCGTADPTPAEALAADGVVAGFMLKVAGADPMRLQETINVEVVYHILQPCYWWPGGECGISDEMVVNQHEVLVEAFAPYGFAFSRRNGGADDTRSTRGVLGQDAKTDAIKNELRVGSAATLNAYFGDFGDSGLLGFATFPYYYAANPGVDGVVNNGQTMPGGSLYPANEGDTFVHEVGHWLGLYHTFDGDSHWVNGERTGGCSPGDHVHDTPQEDSRAFGCPRGRDTCPWDGLPDPIDNYMDYTDDYCMDKFTEGQRVRMLSMWKEFRSPPSPPSPSASPLPPRPSPSPPPPPPSPFPVCLYLHDGVCDDGGPGSTYSDCACGTDYPDCDRSIGADCSSSNVAPSVALIAGAAGGGAAGLLLLVGGGYLVARRKRKAAAAEGGERVKPSQTGSPPPSSPPASGNSTDEGGMKTTDPSADLPHDGHGLPNHDRVSERVGRARASSVAPVMRSTSSHGFSV